MRAAAISDALAQRVLGGDSQAAGVLHDAVLEGYPWPEALTAHAIATSRLGEVSTLHERGRPGGRPGRVRLIPLMLAERQDDPGRLHDLRLVVLREIFEALSR